MSFKLDPSNEKATMLKIARTSLSSKLIGK